METKEWIGTDVSLEISLHEYGLVITKGKDYDDEWFVLYKVSENAYDTGYIRESEINELMSGNEWVNPKDILSWTGYNSEEIAEYMKLPFIHRLSDLIQYYGVENVMGSSYHTITESEANKLISL